MIVLRRVFERLMAFLESGAGAVAPMTGYAFTRGYCPHCEGKTGWQARVLDEMYMCVQCHRDPTLSPTHYEAARREVEAQGSELERADEPVAEPSGREEAGREVVPA